MELAVWTIVLAILNAPLLSGGSTAALALLPDSVAAGEWWRLFTHPFVHVSWYHLLLDGAAFLLLWNELAGPLRARLACVAASAIGSVGAAAIASPEFWTAGLCGLSGIAHGLMAKQGLERWHDGLIGRAIVFAVLGKSVIEGCSGAALFNGLHFGLLGTPIVACHLGGVGGAMLFHAVIQLYGRGNGGHAADARAPLHRSASV
jgi:membrane associated rhomboid family serine protease